MKKPQLERQFSLPDALEFIITQFLTPYAKDWHWFSVSNADNVIEVLGRKKKEDTSAFILLRLGINPDNEEVYIYNIFVPQEDRRQGIGFRLISLIYQICKKFRFALCLVDMTDSFRDRMLLRGALETNTYDALQIVDETNLT